MPYQDRHLLGKILLRSGKKISVIFYGGQGASGELEVGHLLGMQLQRPSKGQSVELFGCRQWQLRWYHRQIRQNYRAFALACFYLEVVNYCAMSAILGAEEEDRRQEELFKVVSNGIYYLDGAQTLNHRWHQNVFLAKLLIANGIFPQLDNCLLDERSLTQGRHIRQLRIDQGGFVGAEEGSDDSPLWCFFRLVRQSSHRELLTTATPWELEDQKIWAYVCYHLPIENHKIKSYSALLKLTGQTIMGQRRLET